MKHKISNYKRKLLILIFALIFHCYPAQANSIQKKIINTAKAEIGNGETISDNKGSDILKYFDAKMQRAWCCAFVQWVLKQSKVKEFEDIYSSRQFFNRAKELGLTVRYPEKGDIVVWWRTHKTNSWHGHIGIIENIRFLGKKGYTIETIEGNVGEFPAKVKRCKHRTDLGYNMKRLLGYVRIPSKKGGEEK